MTTVDLEERTASFPACPECDGDRTYRYRFGSDRFFCPDCKTLFSVNEDSMVTYDIY